MSPSPRQASHLGAALLQLLYQTKTLSTAIMGVVILGKALRLNQWAALTMLVVGVVTAQARGAAPRLRNPRTRTRAPEPAHPLRGAARRRPPLRPSRATRRAPPPFCPRRAHKAGRGR